MIIKEYGKENTDIIILLHGGGLSWWNYKDEAEILGKKFHVVLPILDGHSQSDRDFVNINSNATEIISCIDENYNGKVLAICGLSLGAQILTEILSIRADICQYSIIESALIEEMPLVHALIESSINISYWDDYKTMVFKICSLSHLIFGKSYLKTTFEILVRYQRNQ